MRNIVNVIKSKLRLTPVSKSLFIIPISLVLVIVSLFTLLDAETINDPMNLPQDTISGSILEVHFIDVGQADASLILCDGKSMLVDGGNTDDSNLIYTYLKKHGIDHLDYIINTHPHEDHVGGLAGALTYATVDTALGSVTEYDSRDFNNFLKHLDKRNVSIRVPEAGDTFSLGSAEVKILGPVRLSEDMNNNSIVLGITYGKISFLFTGDAERDEEQDILEQEFDLSSTVLKVGHHGSGTSSTYPFLREIMPEYAVISVGNDNSYGHPHENVMSRLRDVGAKVMRTDTQGDIVFTSDGESVSVSSSKEIPNEDIAEITYALNTNTKKFHYPHCSSVSETSEKNKKESDLSRDEIISQGYSPCGSCMP